MTAAALIRAGEPVPARPWDRWRLDPAAWRDLAATLPGDPLELLALWADQAEIHALFLEKGAMPLLASVPVVAGRYPALSPVRPGAAWPERAIHDVWGHEAEGSAGAGPWLDHGHWPQRHPMAAHPAPMQGAAEPPEFAAPVEEALHQIGLGPVGGEVDPGHLRVTAAGERVQRLEARLGYAHRGVLSLLAGRTPQDAAALVARIDGEAAVAHGLAFARAVEAALGVVPPPRALALRRVLEEMERMAIHLLVLGRAAAQAGTAGAAVPGAPLAAPPPWGPLRESLLRASALAFGHRLLMGVVVPGGLARDLAPGADAALLSAVAALAAALPGLMAEYDAPGGLASRAAGKGVATPAMVGALAVGGVAGRAAGRGFDARRLAEAAPLPHGPVLCAGDADARLRLRLAELPESLHLLRQTLAALPEGPVAAPVPPGDGEGLGAAEGPHGDGWCWVRMQGGTVGACFLADPAWRCWPLVEQAAAGAALADLPLVLRSFAPTVAGPDL